VTMPRYSKYRNSCVEWLGIVPEHWQLTPLFGAMRERTEPNAGLIERNLLSLSYGRIVRKDIESNDGLLPESFETYQIVRPGDIVLRLTDLQNDKRSLRSALVEEVGMITSAYLAIYPTGPDSRFMHYLLRAYDVTKVFYSMGGGLRQAMKFDDLKRLPLLLPPKAEQLAIAAFLDRETARIDALVTEQRRLMELLKEKRQAVISHAVTKGLSAHVPMKDSGIEWLGAIPAHWVLSKVKVVSTFATSGPRGWSERVSDDGALFVQSGDLNDLLEIDFANAKRVRVDASDSEAIRTRLANGDVVVCITGAKTGNVAVAAHVSEPSYVNQHLCLVRPDVLRVSPKFLGTVLKSTVGQTFFELSQYGLKQGLSLEDVEGAPIPCPDLSEQNTIVQFVEQQSSRFAVMSADAQRAVDLLLERRAALISAAVTGKIDVRNVEAEQTAA
jgi:type I restriction enzyme, S subunit